MMRTTRGFQNPQVGLPRQSSYNTASYPPAFLEYAWYASLFYAYLGGTWGIVIPAVGGAILVLLAVACVLSIGERTLSLCRPNAWAFYTGISVLLIQASFHNLTGGAMSEAVAFIGWLALLIIVQTLSLRPKFLHRFALVALVVGVACLPYINIRHVGGIMRAWASGTGISNPNVLGLWFGFCTVYFMFWGLQCRSPLLRGISWFVALGSFYIVTLTVSRTPLLGVVLACIVGFRSVLKRSFVPVFFFAVVIGLIYAAGLFDEEFGYYASRGAEESGRGRLWPAAMERVLHSPWVGFGLDDIRIVSRSGTRFINPHNPFLHLALGAGVIPVVCFLGYLHRVALGAFRLMRTVQTGEAALLPPLLAYGFIEIMMLDLAFTIPLMVVIFALAANASYDMAPQER